MKYSNIIFLLKDSQILLAMKKRGFGTGKLNGFGGKKGEGETMEESAIRELREESCVYTRVSDLIHVLQIDFYFEDRHEFETHVFLLRIWDGAPQETEEMAPQWFDLDKIPYDKMWIADQKWLPLVLSGRTGKAIVRFNKEGDDVRRFEWID